VPLHRVFDAADVEPWLSRNPDEVTFLTGAGTSLDPPAQLASGVALTRRAFEHLFVPDAASRIEDAYRSIGLVDPDGTPRLPRLEVVLGVALGVNPRGVFEVLGDIVDVRPNRYHQLLARHVEAGGRVLTANFDLGIERSMSDASASSRLCHFHRSLATEADLNGLGAFFRSVERGLTAEVTAVFDEVLASSRQLIVMGYSGSDYFDVDPYLAALPGHCDLSHLRVIWVDHRADSSPPLAHRSIRQLTWFAQAGAETILASCDSARVAATIAETRGWPFPVAPPPGPPWRPTASTTDQQRARASVDLHFLMGNVKATRETATEHGVALAIEHLAAICWAEGRYSDARRAWRGGPQDTLAERLHRRERTGACLWAQGRLVPALVVLLRARSLATEALSSDDLDVVEKGLTWVDTTARALEHMDRTELRILPKRRLRRTLTELLARPNQGLGFHISARTSEIRAFLSDGAGSAAAASETKRIVEGMREAESLSGRLNYHHRLLRDEADQGHPRPPEDYVSLREQMRALGATGDAARVGFIPGAERAFTIVQASQLFAGTQFGYWQRLRFLGRFTLKRLRVRLAH
jgi:hypothetical protein